MMGKVVEYVNRTTAEDLAVKLSSIALAFANPFVRSSLDKLLTQVHH